MSIYSKASNTYYKDPIQSKWNFGTVAVTDKVNKINLTCLGTRYLYPQHERQSMKNFSK